MGRFSGTVKQQGEWFIREDGTTRFKASITNSTRATFSLANRMCFFEGLAIKSAILGEYLTREVDGKRYMVNTIQPQPRDTSLDYIFIAMCNQIATLARPEGEDAGSNRVTKWNVYAENVPVFMDTTTRSLKEQNDGLLAQDITIIHIPARFGIRKLDRVYLVKTGVALNDSDYFRVDSISDSLTPLDETVDRSGIDVMQLTEDKRTGDVATEEPPDDGGGTDPGGGGYWD